VYIPNLPEKQNAQSWDRGHNDDGVFQKNKKKEDERIHCTEPEVGRPRRRYYKGMHLGRYGKQPVTSIQNTIRVLVLAPQSSNTGNPIIGADALTPELGQFYEGEPIVNPTQGRWEQ
jgi:hypothetical protein